MVDDATLPGVRGSFGVDDEGTPAQRTVLIDKGVLKAYMTDRLYGKKGDLPLSGNGRRESYRHRPVVRMTNTLILPGESDPESILGSTDKGLFRGQDGAGARSTRSTAISSSRSARVISSRRGEIGPAVRGATLVGNGPQVLMSIDLVGSDLGYGIGTCGKDGQGVPVADAQAHPAHPRAPGGRGGLAMAPLLQVKNLKTEFTSPLGVARAVDGVGFELDSGPDPGVGGASRAAASRSRRSPSCA